MFEAQASEAFIQAFAPKTARLVSGCMPLEAIRGYRVELRGAATPDTPSRLWELVGSPESSGTTDGSRPDMN